MDPDDPEQNLERPVNKTPEFLQDAFSAGETRATVF